MIKIDVSVNSEFSNEIYLDIRNVTRDQNGTYTCLTTDHLNKSVSKEFYLIVYHSPKFLTVSKNLTLNETQSGGFECSIEKSPKPNIKWTHSSSDQHLEHTIVFSNSTFESSILKLDNVSRNSIGAYSCFDQDYPQLKLDHYLFINCKYKNSNFNC